MSPALANDGALSFVMLLALLLAMMLAAVIRLPEWDGSSKEDDRPRPGPAPPCRATDVQARAAATIARAAAVLPARPPPGPQPGDTATMLVPAAATSQPGYTARHAGGPVPGEDAIRRPQVYGAPPWEPAPRPSRTQ